VDHRKRAGLFDPSRLAGSQPNWLFPLHVGQKLEYDTYNLVTIQDSFDQDLEWNTPTTGACCAHAFKKRLRAIEKERGGRFELN
jgi:hypothetical protein